MVAHGRDFVVAPFFIPKIGEDPPKKKSPLQNKWVFGLKVCEDQKKKKSVGFWPE